MNEKGDLLWDRRQDGANRRGAGNAAPSVECLDSETFAGAETTPPVLAAEARRKELVSDLEPPEQIVIWVLRQWLSGGPGEQLVRQELFNLCRLTGVESAIQGLERLIDTLGQFARRVMTLHCCRCREVSHDERLLLFLIAAAQRQEAPLVQALARWLVPAECAETLIDSARSLGLALSQGGHNLPLELPSPPPELGYGNPPPWPVGEP